MNLTLSTVQIVGILAAALTVALAIIQQVLQTAPHFGHWQTDLVLVLEIVEGGLLALAAARAIGARAADHFEEDH